MKPELISGHERRRQASRKAILDATTVLIREYGNTEISVSEIAEQAKVNPATPYNHFGSKTGILGALVLRSMHRQSMDSRSRKNPHPLGVIEQTVLSMTMTYCEDTKLYQPLFAALLPVNLDNPLTQTAVARVRKELEQAQAKGFLSQNVECQFLSRQLETFCLGTLTVWCTGGFTSEECLDHVANGVAYLLTGTNASMTTES